MIDSRFVKWSMVLVKNGEPSPSIANLYTGNIKGLIFYKTRELAMNAKDRKNDSMQQRGETHRYCLIKVHDSDAQKEHYESIANDKAKKEALRRRRIGF